jgi:hypothetical protein
MNKIAQENQRMLQRLQEKKPNYNAREWEHEEQRQVRHAKNICEYPYQLRQSGSSKNYLSMSTNTLRGLRNNSQLNLEEESRNRSVLHMNSN